jgi:dolichol-phosphate mannosyltransferase
MKLSVIVPCYDEADNVSKLYDELLPIIESLIMPEPHHDSEKIHSAQLIFVDDGSQDTTYSRLKQRFGDSSKSGITSEFLKHETNLGLGAALRTGFSHAEGDIILTVDSDGTYKFSDIPLLLTLLTPNVDIVTASPYHPRGGVSGVPAYRLLLSKGSSLIYRVLVDRHIHTYTCLFRAYRAEVVKNIGFKSNGFLAGTEILVYAMLRGYHVTELPTVLYKRIYGVSKAKIMKTILSHLRFQGGVVLYRLQLVFGFRPKQIT